MEYAALQKQMAVVSPMQDDVQMEDVNSWECGRPVISDRPPGSSEADDALGLDHDALNGTLSAFEQNSFGIQSAFHIDSDSDEVLFPFFSLAPSSRICCMSSAFPDVT